MSVDSSSQFEKSFVLLVISSFKFRFSRMNFQRNKIFSFRLW